jgi:hypothetical protein
MCDLHLDLSSADPVNRRPAFRASFCWYRTKPNVSNIYIVSFANVERLLLTHSLTMTNSPALVTLLNSNLRCEPMGIMLPGQVGLSCQLLSPLAIKLLWQGVADVQRVQRYFTTFPPGLFLTFLSIPQFIQICRELSSEEVLELTSVLQAEHPLFSLIDHLASTKCSCPGLPPFTSLFQSIASQRRIPMFPPSYLRSASSEEPHPDPWQPCIVSGDCRSLCNFLDWADLLLVCFCALGGNFIVLVNNLAELPSLSLSLQPCSSALLDLHWSRHGHRHV